MEVVLDVLGAAVAPVAVEHAEDLDFGPVLDAGVLGGWLDHVQDNRDSVLVRFANGANVRVRSETFDRSKTFCGNFRRLELLEHRRFLRLRALDQFLNLLLQHRVFALFWRCLCRLLLLDRAHYLKLRHVGQVRRLRGRTRLFLLPLRLLHIVLLLCVVAATAELRKELSDSRHDGLHDILGAEGTLISLAAILLLHLVAEVDPNR